jgi:hypothetical protein
MNATSRHHSNTGQTYIAVGAWLGNSHGTQPTLLSSRCCLSRVSLFSGSRTEPMSESAASVIWLTMRAANAYSDLSRAPLTIGPRVNAGSNEASADRVGLSGIAVRASSVAGAANATSAAPHLSPAPARLDAALPATAPTLLPIHSTSALRRFTSPWSVSPPALT